MTLLKSIRIKGFRSIKDSNLDLRKLNVLIGANGAGKSNFVSFFRLLNEMVAGRLRTYVGISGRASSILHLGQKTTSFLDAELEFEDDIVDKYAIRLAPTADGSLLFVDEDVQLKKDGSIGPTTHSLGSGHFERKIAEFANRGDETASGLLRILNDCRVYHFHDTSRVSPIRSGGYINDNRWLKPDGANLAAMLFLYRERFRVAYDSILSAMQKVLPEFGDFELGPSRLNPNLLNFDWYKKEFDYLFGPHQISDGSLRAAALFTLFLQPEEYRPAVIVLDEPELGLHPFALEILAGLIRAASEKTQVIVATQNETFLNLFEPQEIVIVECNQGQSTFKRLDPNELKEWLEDYSIGELWQRNVVGGGPLP